MRRNIAFFYGILLLFMVAGVTARSLLAQTAADNLLIDEDVLSVDDVLPLGDDPAEKGAEDVPLPEDPTLDLLPEPAPADDVPKLAPVDDGADLDSLIESAFSDAVAEGVPEPPSLPTAAYGAGDVEASVVPMAPASPQQQMIDVITGGEILRRQAFERHALETLGRADEILKERDYDKSRRLYEQSIEVIRQSGERPENTALRQRARAGIAESLYREALLLTKLMDYDKAEQQARAASSYGHAKAPKLVGEISELKKDPPLPPPAAVPPRWRQDDFREAEKEVADLLRRGREHFVSGEYRKSQVLFESVIKRDPNNTEAIRMRQKVAQMRLDISRMEVDSTHVDMVRQIGDAWNPRDYASEDDVRPTFSTEDANRTQRQETDEDRILSKMEAIRIPEIDFRQANIHDVVNFLQEASVEYDPSDDPNAPKGVNIILNLQAIGETDASAPAAEADPFGFGAAEPVGGGGEPVRHESTVGAPAHAQAIRVSVGVHGQCCVHTPQIIFLVDDAPFTSGGELEVVAISRRPSRVGIENKEPGRREHVEGREEGVAVSAMGPTVDLQNQGIRVPFSMANWSNHPAFHLCAIRYRPG